MNSQTVAPTRINVPRITPSRGARSLFAEGMRMLLALDARARERSRLTEIEPHTLRDVSITQTDIDKTLARPDAHLRSILLRGRG